MSRLLIVSNRVPGHKNNVKAGGLSVALRAALEERGGLWLGWSGRVRDDRSASATMKSAGRFDLATIDLTKAEYEGYYKGYANRALWPLFHNRLLLCDFNATAFETYRSVNRLFAQQAKALLRADDIIWAHDYHLIPFADELRKLGVTASVGFFLHIPFPPPETMLALPHGRDLMNMLLSYDVIGLQTERDLKNFTSYVEEEMGGAITGEGIVTANNKSAFVGAFPIGIDTRAFSQVSLGESAQLATSKLSATRGDQTWIVGVDRLDYTKGLAEKFRAFDQFLKGNSEYQGRVQLMQIAAPSRETLPAYEKTRAELESIVGEVNGRFGTLDWSPINYIRRTYGHTHLAALYRCSRVGLVTPLRDGMNLVAKEYVASQDPNDPGVLVLSEFAGAADELKGALTVNPYNIAETADAIRRALVMPHPERQRRWRIMMQHLLANDVHSWRKTFLRTLEKISDVAAAA